MPTHRVAIDQQKAIGASGRRGKRLLPTDLTNLLLHRDGIADDARSVGAVVAVVAADVSHRLLVGVLTLPANRLRWPDRQRPPTTLPRHCGVVRRPMGDTMAAGGPAKALHRGARTGGSGRAGLRRRPRRSGNDRTHAGIRRPGEMLLGQLAPTWQDQATCRPAQPRSQGAGRRSRGTPARSSVEPEGGISRRGTCADWSVTPPSPQGSARSDPANG